MDAGEEQGRAETELCDSIAVSFGDSLDHAVQAESAQVVGHSAWGDGMRHLPGEHCELFPQVSIGETAGQKTEPDQKVPQCQHAQIGGSQRGGALPIHF